MCRCTIDGSSAPHPFVQWWASDNKGNLPSRDFNYMEYRIRKEENERLQPWIDPDSKLGDTVWVTFSRFEGSDQKHQVVMIDREKTKE